MAPGGVIISPSTGSANPGVREAHQNRARELLATRRRSHRGRARFKSWGLAFAGSGGVGRSLPHGINPTEAVG
jgi:hypothetical protein